MPNKRSSRLIIFKSVDNGILPEPMGATLQQTLGTPVKRQHCRLKTRGTRLRNDLVVDSAHETARYAGLGEVLS